MSEELQHLIERIRTEGLARADAEAKAIVDKARADAASLERAAKEKAAALLKKAEADAQAYAERGRKSLEQASRDLVLTVRQAVESLFDRLLRDKVESALTPEAFQALLKDVVLAYAARGHAADDMAAIVPPEAEQAMRDYFLAAFRDSVARGVVIRSSNDVVKGFRVAFRNNHVEHDFTAETIAEALARLVRPHLAERIRNAAAADAPAAP